jgi:hypothetical protein
VKDVAPLMFDDEEAIEYLERQRGHAEDRDSFGILNSLPARRRSVLTKATSNAIERNAMVQTIAGAESVISSSLAPQFGPNSCTTPDFGR